MRLAVVQVHDFTADVTAGTAHCLRTLQSCAETGADLVLFPELYLGGYVLDGHLQHKAEQAERAVGRLQAAVDELGLSAVLGLPLRHGAALLNGAAVLRPGLPPSFYGKTHLFQTENDWFAPGGDFWNGEIAGWPCGILICYELAFPEIARTLALRGARLLLAPAAFGARRAHVWEAATAGRALENSCYLAAANHSGPGALGDFLGGSRIVDPDGSTDAVLGAGEGVISTDLDADLVDAVRGGADGGHTYFEDRRPELYADLSRRPEQPRP